MSGRDRILIAIEEEEEEASALHACVSAKAQAQIPNAIDDDLKALSEDVDALKAKLIEARQKVEALP